MTTEAEFRATIDSESIIGEFANEYGEPWVLYYEEIFDADTDQMREFQFRAAGSETDWEPVEFVMAPYLRVPVTSEIRFMGNTQELAKMTMLVTDWAKAKVGA